VDEKDYQYAQQLEKEAKWAEAADHYIQLLRDDSPLSLNERIAWCLSRAEKYNDAIKYLYILHEKEPQSAKWPYMIGYQFYCQKNWSIAITWFEKALLLYSDYFIVKYRLAYAYVQSAGVYKNLTKAEYWKALSNLNDCHKLWITFDDTKKKKEKSTYFDINFLHGKMLMGLPNHREEAIKHFQDALSIKPNDEFAKYNLSKTFYLQGDYEKAKINIPINQQYYIIELDAYIDAKQGYYDEAISKITKLLIRRQKDYLYCFLSEVYLLKGDLDNAFKMAQLAVTKGNTNHKNYFTLAKVYYKYSLLNCALENLEKAISLKSAKYDTTYEESELLREKILSNILPDYVDDEEIIQKLNELSGSGWELGVICKYNSNKGFGFIKRTSNDIFFHVSNCMYKNISIGDRVKFFLTTNDRGSNAIDVQKQK
jgi:tetratricopeptide (TPR) repeat protein